MNYTKTDLGQRVFKERAPTLSIRQRAAFILFDGVQTMDEVLAATAGLGCSRDDVAHLLAQGYIAEPAVAEPEAQAALLPQQRYALAYPLATMLTASLGLRGFKLNLAVEAAGGYDDLLALLPRIAEAVGHEACAPLAHALRR
jgi:hypothetical protein